jgi:hypothetical protein
MKERLRLLNQSTTTTNLQHLGHAMRFVSKTDFAFITTIEKKKAPQHVAVQQRRFCRATRQSFLWPPATLLAGPRCTIVKMLLRGAAPLRRPIGRMLPRAVFLLR